MEFERIKSIEEERKNGPSIQIKDFCNRATLKGIVTSIGLAYFPQATGCFIFSNYASLMLEISGSALSVDVSTIILAVAQIFGGLISTQLGDTFGRKTISKISLIGAAFGLFIFAGYSYMHHYGYDVSNVKWLPVLCFSFIMFITSAGILSLANTCAVENFPPNVCSILFFYFSSIAVITKFIILFHFRHGRLD